MSKLPLAVVLSLVERFGRCLSRILHFQSLMREANYIRIGCGCLVMVLETTTYDTMPEVTLSHDFLTRSPKRLTVEFQGWLFECYE